MIELIAGGARSGKSRYALTRAESLTETPIMVATATAGDAQMAARIQRHREERGDHWQVLEEPLLFLSYAKSHNHAHWWFLLLPQHWTK